ncbi:hypothetical protein HKBW3S47_01493, partial [Candidatus Hakubella thermalkaliphila]
MTRKLLIEGVRRWKLEHALKLYREGGITKERAAELAEVSSLENNPIFMRCGAPRCMG